jgi:S-adenosylmethionine:tRNA ribosyltransferase-isomerase
MIDPKKIFIRDYTYDLPESRIAKYPLQERDASKLLIYREGKISEDVYRKIAKHIPPNSLLIFNNTKVIEARLLFQKPTGGVIEIFCLEPDEQYKDITNAMKQHNKVLWQCLIGGASKWKHGQVLQKKIEHAGKEIILEARYIEKRIDYFIIELSWNDGLSFAEVLHCTGAIPLPPYIKREADESDAERYQTIYAHHEGSVAAPTAGLHFTDEIFQSLKEKNIQPAFVTLHVGAGTFKPVKSETIAEHEMHAEFINISKATIEKIIANLSSTIISVGTTSLRTIESLYWLGVKLSMMNRESSIDPERPIELNQWECYELERMNIEPKQALESLLAFMNKHQMERLFAKTQIIIVPGYKPKIAKALITNFHQPQSTLLVLIAALIGDDWKKVYDYALENNFRFLSYGDGCLFWFADQAGTGVGTV